MLDLSINRAAESVFERLVSGLEIEFGRDAAEGLARIFVEAEGADFYWEARANMRWLGSWESLDEEAADLLDRVAVSGVLDQVPYVAVVVVDSFDAVQALLGVRHFESRSEADRALAAVH